MEAIAFFAVLAAGVWFFTRPAKKRAKDAPPTGWDTFRDRVGRARDTSWNGVQIVAYFTVTTLIAVFLVYVALGPDVLLPEDWTFTARFSRPWSGWWFPQGFAGLSAIQLFVAKRHVWRWAMHPKKAAKEAFDEIKQATEHIFVLVVGYVLYITTSLALAFLSALWREVSAMI